MIFKSSESPEQLPDVQKPVKEEQLLGVLQKVAESEQQLPDIPIRLVRIKSRYTWGFLGTAVPDGW
jgi:hypothetical protein